MNSQHLFVGIDISKLKHDVAIVDDQQQAVTPCFVIKENADGYRSLLQKFDIIKQRSGNEYFHIGMESTGDYWKNLYYFLNKTTDWPVTVINPLQSRYFARSKLRRATTDKIDALDIARYMQERRPDPTPPKAFGLQNIRDIDKQILSFVKERNVNINRLRIELGKTFPELEQESSSLTALRLLVLLYHYPTAEMINQAAVEQLSQLTCGKSNRHIPETFVKHVKQLATDSIACKTGPDDGIVGQTLALRLIEIQAHVNRLKKEIVRVYRQHDGNPSILTTIPGVAPLTATTLEAYIGDVNRFSEYKKIVAYFGMNPTICTSGISVNRKGRLQKKGNARVRCILFMTVLSMIRFKVDPIYDFYQRKVAQGKPKMVAVGASMRKLLVIVYHMLKNNEPFQLKK